MREFSASITLDDANSIVEHTSYYRIPVFLDGLSTLCHASAVRVGWYKDPKTGWQINRNFGEVIALMHSELSEALEGARKDLSSDKIPEFTAIEEEFADTLIRLFDTAGALELRLGEAFTAKLAYNQQREDHKLESRKEGGKQF